MNVDVNWFEVLAHHASRRPDRAMTVFEGEATTYGEMAARVAALAGGLHERGVGEGDVVALLSYNCPEFLEAMFAANRLGAAAMPINWRLAAPEVRYILQHSEARALVCDEPLVGLADEACAGLEDSLVRSCIASAAPDGWTTLAELRAGAAAPRPGPQRARRRPPADVHVRHDRPPQGRDDHPRQPGVEEPGAHRRVRVHRRRPRPGVRAALPRRRARPHDHLSRRSRRHDDHPPGLRRRGGDRRAGAVAGDHGLAGASHGERDHGAARTWSGATCPRCA